MASYLAKVTHFDGTKLAAKRVILVEDVTTLLTPGPVMAGGVVR